ncbi:hypothetical protein [Hydrogenophaga sp. NH-16]|uniref:hypothetical protein n=1 Tax=Hydrogenophaga sp. NH-16 TaxID=2184519 RepID=UPI000FDA168B|nr:hypothetical protein [Hydrogenophaga sp. NH-16]
MAKLKTPPPPVSKTVQRLLAQIHAEAEAATLAALSAKDGIVALQGIDRQTARVYCHPTHQSVVMFADGGGYKTRMSRQHTMPESWRDSDYMKDAWRPGQWSVVLYQRDGQGREWECALGAHITDDFGTLVCVEGGAV